MDPEFLKHSYADRESSRLQPCLFEESSRNGTLCRSVAVVGIEKDVGIEEGFSGLRLIPGETLAAKGVPLREAGQCVGAGVSSRRIVSKARNHEIFKAGATMNRGDFGPVEERIRTFDGRFHRI